MWSNNNYLSKPVYDDGSTTCTSSFSVKDKSKKVLLLFLLAPYNRACKGLCNWPGGVHNWNANYGVCFGKLNGLLTLEGYSLFYSIPCKLGF